MNVKCPCCGAQYSVEVVLQSEAGREMLALVAKLPEPVSRALMTYLGLFRPAERVLSWDRALKLANQVLALGPVTVLLPALEDTIVALRERQAQPSWKPLRNHNYLKRVLESVEASQIVRAELPAAVRPTGRASKHLSAIDALDD